MTGKLTELDITEYNDRDDRDAVLILDGTTAEDGWDELEIDGVLSCKFIKGYVARVGDSVVGFIFVSDYTAAANPLCRILRLTVAPRSRRRGVGAALVKKAKQHLDHNRNVARLITDVDSDDVRETEAAGFLAFLDAEGFKSDSEGLSSAVYKNDDHEIEFSYSLAYTLPGGRVFKNRIKHFLKKGK